jgi:hypothetical protein
VTEPVAAMGCPMTTQPLKEDEFTKPRIWILAPCGDHTLIGRIPLRSVVDRMASCGGYLSPGELEDLLKWGSDEERQMCLRLQSDDDWEERKRGAILLCPICGRPREGISDESIDQMLEEWKASKNRSDPGK